MSSSLTVRSFMLSCLLPLASADVTARAIVRLLRAEEEILRGQLSIDEGLLLLVGAGEHVVMHETEQAVDLEPRRLHPLHDRGGKRAVLATAVGRDMTVLGRECDQRAGLRL